MIRRIAWTAITLFPLFVWGGLWRLRRDFRQPNLRLPTQMAESPAYRSQSGNPVFANGETLQTPVPGTLARRKHAFHYSASDADRKRAGEELLNPVPPNEANLAEGKRLFETYCLPCHGNLGKGDGPLIPTFPNPPNFHSDRLKLLKDGEIFHTITLGRGKMGSFASQVDWEDRWRIIHHIRYLQMKEESVSP